MNACIVGFGAIGPVHAEALLGLEHVKLYAICDSNRERADFGAKSYAAKAYYDFEDCLCDQMIDCIHICTPHYLHFEMIIKALRARKKVIVEKPVVMKKEELEILFSQYDVTNIYPVMQNRKNNCVTMLKDTIKNDTSLGALKGIKGILTWSRDAAYYKQDQWRGTKEHEGGGVLINQAIHTLDLMICLAGAAEEIKALASNHSLEGVIEVEDTVEAYIRFKNGATGIFYATNAYSCNSSVQLELHFENKIFKYVDGMLLSGGEILCKDSENYSGKKYWGSGHTKVLAEYYDGQTSLNLFDVKDTMDVMFAAYESANSHGKSIQIGD